MSSALRLLLAFVILFAAGVRTIEVIALRSELGELRAERVANDAALVELRGLRESIARDPDLAAAIAERWTRGELLLP
jgi:hypothetical protein